MPLYEYDCLECRARETRVAGLDDHTALCIDCGGIMLRQDEDIFQAYFTPLSIGLQVAGDRLK